MSNGSVSALLGVAALGSALAAIRIRSVGLGVLGYLLAGMAAGWFGIRLPDFVLDFGMVLFVYAMGVQSGPGFFEAFRRDGLRLLGLAAATTGAMALVVALVGLALGLSPGSIAGALCGSYNSPLALAAVQGMMHSADPAITFGLLFPVALLGMVLVTYFLPKLMGMPPQQAKQEHAQRQKLGSRKVVTRYFRVTNPACEGHTLSELRIGEMTGAVIATVESHGAVLPGTGDRVLHMGDIVKAVGTEEALQKCRVALGEETYRTRRHKGDVVLRRVMVTRREIVGKRLQDLGLEEKFDAVVTRIRRSGVTIPPTGSTQLYYGDKLEVVVRRENAERLVEYLGNDIQGFYRAELAPAFVAMAVGALLGMVPIPLPGGVTVRLGLAGGVLTTALVAGRLGRLGPAIFTMPAESALVLRRLGSLLLMVSVGVMAGRGLEQSALGDAPWLLAGGLLAALVGSAAAVLVARRAMGADVVEAVGYVAGALGSTPAMEAGCSALDDDGPAATYALVYPIAIVLQLVTAQILVTVLQAL